MIHNGIVQIGEDEPTVYKIQTRQLGDSRSVAAARGVQVCDRAGCGGWLEGHQQDAGEPHTHSTHSNLIQNNQPINHFPHYSAVRLYNVKLNISLSINNGIQIAYKSYKFYSWLAKCKMLTHHHHHQN